MRPEHYTDEEWNYLVQPYDWAWPDDWSERRQERALWEPTLRAICERYGLAFDPDYTRAHGSHAVFLFPEFVIKLYARYSPVWFPREVEALQVVGAIPEAHAPRLIGHDDRAAGADGQPFIVMERLPGEPWKEIRDRGPQSDRIDGVRQIAVALRAIHGIDPSTLTSYRSDPDEWVAKIRARARLAPEYLKESLPARFLPQVDRVLADHLDAITADFEPHLISTDVNSFNSLFVRENGGVRLSGQIDFGDMEVGPIEYEWPSVVQKCTRHGRGMTRAFFEAYGLALPFPEDLIRRLKVYSLLHRFPTVEYFAERHPEVDSLDELLELQWEVVKRENG